MICEEFPPLLFSEITYRIGIISSLNGRIHQWLTSGPEVFFVGWF